MTKHSKNKKILIVEDEIITALMLQKFLIKNGFIITDIVATREDVLSSLKNKLPDLILMDTILDNDNDGIEIVKELKQLYTIPVIYSTGNSDIATIEKLKETTPQGIIFKPIDKQMLLSVINSVFETDSSSID